jgi:hypothetical protein
LLGDRSHDVDCELVRRWHVASHEFDLGLDQVGNEQHGPAQAIQASDEQCRLASAAFGERQREFGSIRLLTALDLGKLCHDLRAGCIRLDRSVLGFDAQAARSLTSRRDALITDE